MPKDTKNYVKIAMLLQKK